MNGFNFKLQKVLDLRERKEQESARDLIEARRRVDDAERARQTLELVREQRREEFAQAHGSGRPVGQLWTATLLMERLQHAIEAADANVVRAHRDMLECETAFTSAVMERRVLSELRRRQLDTWKTERSAADRKEMDDIAITRFNGSAPVPSRESA